MRKGYLLCAVSMLSCLYQPMSFAGMASEVPVTPSPQLIAGISVGAAWYEEPGNRSINLYNDVLGRPIRNVYTYHSDSQQAATVNAHIGYLFSFPQSNFNISAELLGFYNFKRLIAGQVWEGGVPQFNNFNYSYNVQSKGLMAESRLFYAASSWSVMPYALFGIGSSWNKAYNYNESPRNLITASARGPISSNTSTQFAYEAGAGLSWRNNNTIVSVEYKYQDLGDAKLGLYAIQTYNDPLMMKLRSNQVLLNVTQVIA